MKRAIIRYGFLVAVMMVLLPQAAYPQEVLQKVNIDGDEFEISRSVIRWQTLPVNHRTLQGIQVGRETVAGLKSKLGQAEPQAIGEDRFLCYEPSLKSSKFKLVFDIWGEGVVGAYLVPKNAPGKFAGLKCTKTNKIKSKAATSSGLRLGMRKQDLKKILGSPSNVFGNNHYYIYESEAGQKYLFSGVKATLSKNIVTSLYIYQSTSK